MSWLHESLRKLAIAVCFVLLALLWTFLLQHYVSHPFVFLFFGAIMASAWFGGYVAGMSAVVLSMVLIEFFQLPPYYSFSITGDSQGYFAALVLSALAASLVSASRARANTAQKQAMEMLESRVQARTAELHSSNHALVEERRLLLDLTEAIPLHIWKANPDGRIAYANANLTRYLKDGSGELHRAGIASFLHPDEKDEFELRWHHALKSEIAVEAELRIRDSIENYRWFFVRVMPHFDSSGNCRCWYGIHVDMHELREAEGKLNYAQEMLARLQRISSMAEMAASIAHELNQPLTAVLSHASACQARLEADSVDRAKLQNAIEKIVLSSRRASDVVDRIKRIYRRDQQALEPVEIHELVRSVVELLRGEMIRRSISIRVEPDLASAWVRADLVQMQQVLLNLIRNAMDAIDVAQNPPRREVYIALESQVQSGIVVVSIKDTGEGIAKDMEDKIFQPFFTTRKDGTGMGLAICRSIMESHGGRIWHESSKSGGASFCFSLPRTEE